ncbi:MAG: 30S ribosomal protein S7 [Candidatus Marinimicrobia bacterium]|nr:30S ribosomal protein S7 [Candidatus Neomarinimicrobiota bacterium]|tara:strand:- start:238 stop:705 length:468 start_codon:yes stop_codon:yes gene_type:complete
MRRRRPEKRTILPDPLFNDMLAAKFINNIMSDGKKSLAEKIFYTSIEKIEETTKTKDGLEVFKKAINNVCPMLEVKSKRIGGATYQVPVEVPENRKIALAMRWIISFAQSRKGNSMSDRLAAELLAAYNNEGSSVKKKEDTHKMAEANKAFAHFR